MTPKASSRVQSILSPHFVGRAGELAHLDDALAKAAGGTPATVLLAGEAGVGKSRLIREFAGRAKASGSRTLSGSCIDLGAGDLPYAPLIEAFRRLVRESGRQTVRDLVGPAYDELAALVPFLGEPAGADSMAPTDSASQARVFGAVLRLLDHLGADRPVLMVVEDLHWADRSTLDLLTFLVRGLDDEHVLLLVSYRTSDLPPRHPLRAVLAEMDHSRRVRRLELSRFDLDELRVFLTDLLGSGARYDLVNLVFEMSDGNAFFAEELAVATAGRGASGAGAVDAFLGRLPRSLRDVVLARIELLTDDAQDVLRAAATAGRRVSHELLASVCALPYRRLVAALRECVAHHVLLTDPVDGTYVFRHALAREAVHQDLLPGERVRLHAALAASLTAEPRLSYAQQLSIHAELAYHWHEAGNLPHAVTESVRAGESAAAVQAFAEAERQYERALDLWDQVPAAEALAGKPYHQVLAQAADAARWRGHVGRAVQRIRAAVAQVDEARQPVRAGELYERLGRYLWEAGDGGGSLRAYERAGVLLSPEPPSALSARVMADIASTRFRAGQYAEGLRLATQAAETARTVGAETEEGRALAITGVTLTMLGRPDEGVPVLRTALRIAESTGHLEDLFRAYGNLAFALESAGRLDESLQVSLAGLDRSRRLGLERASGSALLLSNAAAVLVLLGRWDEAEELAVAAIERETPAAVAAYPHLVLAQTSVGRGRFAAAEEHLAIVRAMSAIRPEPHLVGPLHGCTAELAVWQGRHAAARHAVGDGLRLVGAAEDTLQVLRLCAMGIRAEADHRERLVALARRSPVADAELLATADGLRRTAERVGDRPLLPEPAALLASARAEHARLDPDSGAPTWADVAAAWEVLGCGYGAAYAYWRQAEAVLGGADGSAPLPALRKAYSVVSRLGAAPLRAEIVALARRARLDLAEPPAGEADRSATPPDPFGLTPREREVLRHLCDGHSNRQISRALFISEKTASVHVSNILTKLAVPSRGEAAAVAYRIGLNDPEPPAARQGDLDR